MQLLRDSHLRRLCTSCTISRLTILNQIVRALARGVLIEIPMKKTPTKSRSLLVSIEKVRELSTNELHAVNGAVKPCPNTRATTVNCDTTD